MLRKLVLAVVIAVAVTLGCLLLGGLLITIDISIAATVGAFLKIYAGVIGLLCALWYFFTN